MSLPDCRKCRTLHLADPQQVEGASLFLREHFGMQVLPLPHLSRLILVYDLPHQQLGHILACLQQAGIQLADNWWLRMHQRLICYSEEVQLDNMGCHVCATKGREVYCQLYQQHPHGDHDDTPEELRLER